MNIEHKLTVNIEDCERDALKLLAEIHNQCVFDEAFGCSDCLFCPSGDESCIPYMCEQMLEGVVK